jgi:hypothetical protein
LSYFQPSFYSQIFVEQIQGLGVWEDRNLPDDDMAEGSSYGIRSGTPLYE